MTEIFKYETRTKGFMSAKAVSRVETGEQKEVVIWSASGSSVGTRADALSKTGFECWVA